MKKICVFTGTRAEYGLLTPLIRAIESEPDFQLALLVSGTHLSPDFGLTYKQIEADGFLIDEKVEMLLSSDTPVGTAKSTGLGILGYADALQRLACDFVVILGDRFEAFALATTAYLLKIPIIHLHGGEITEGATDEALRHAISKMAYLHFTSTEIYRQRVIQLGEAPDRVFNVGAIGLDSIKGLPLLSLEALTKTLDFPLASPYILVTFHPVTLEAQTSREMFDELLEALDEFPDVQVLFTLPNADADGRVIIDHIRQYVQKNIKRAHASVSLGQIRYLSAMKHSSAVVGNSSSGIIEAPSFGIPTVNIGDRQKGRILTPSILCCENTKLAIVDSLSTALSAEMQTLSRSVQSPYGEGTTTQEIMQVLRKVSDVNLKKAFYDLP